MNLEELGRRAVACKHWRWRDGSKRVHAEHRWAWRLCGWRWFPCDERSNAVHDNCFAEAIPDLSDPATLGCLLALVREAWPAGEATTNVHANYSPGRGHYRQWSCYYCTGGDWRQALADTEAEVLVAALEAAP